MIHWQPTRRPDSTSDFDGLEHALERAIHPDIKAYYARYWSANIRARAPDGELVLLFLWNLEDVDRLIENLISHAVACRHNKTPFAPFFACPIDDDDYFLTVANDTGEVLLERPGYKPIRRVARSLGAFLSTITPIETAPP